MQVIDAPFRLARPGDAAAVAAYHHACHVEAFTPLLSAEELAKFEPYAERFEQWFSSTSDFVTVVAVRDDDQPIGHTTVLGNKLAHLFVNPAHQGQGIGRELLGQGEWLIQEAGHDWAELQTRVGNDRAIGLYQRHGWKLTNEFVEDPLQSGGTVTEQILRKQFDVAR